MGLREKINETTKEYGNKVYAGAGDFLTHELTKDDAWAVAGIVIPAAAVGLAVADPSGAVITAFKDVVGKGVDYVAKNAGRMAKNMYDYGPQLAYEQVAYR